MSPWSEAAPINWPEVERQIRHRDSLESKLLEFFDVNPDEELTVSDACVKFGAADRVNMGKLMKGLSERSLLSRYWDDGHFIYQRGGAT